MPDSLANKLRNASIALAHCEVEGHQVFRLCINTEDGVYYADMEGWEGLELAQDMIKVSAIVAKAEAEKAKELNIDQAMASSMYVLQRVTLALFQLSQAATKQSGFAPNKISLGLISQAYRNVLVKDLTDEDVQEVVRQVLTQCKDIDIEEGAQETAKL